MIVSTVRYKRIDHRGERPMSTSNEFVNIALLTAIFVGLAFLSRLF
jgi:hypothetical protein